MTLASFVTHSLIFDRDLTPQEIEDFSKINLVLVSESVLVGDKLINIGPLTMYPNMWRVNSKQIILNKFDNDIAYFVEGLLYILKGFFKYKEIGVRGYVVSLDLIFGDLHYFYVKDWNLYSATDVVNYFENVKINEQDMLEELKTKYDLICDHAHQSFLF